MSCSWSGISRNERNENVIFKIPFHKYEGIIRMFHKVVQFSDPTFSKVQCEQFLHRCLRNAKQRFEEIKGTRAPVARKRCKRLHQPIDVVQEGVHEDEEVIVEEFIVDPEVPPSLQNQSVEGGVDEGTRVLVEGYIID